MLRSRTYKKIDWNNKVICRIHGIGNGLYLREVHFLGTDLQPEFGEHVVYNDGKWYIIHRKADQHVFVGNINKKKEYAVVEYNTYPKDKLTKLPVKIRKRVVHFWRLRRML